MNSVRGWVIRRLAEDGFKAVFEGADGIHVTRGSMPAVHVGCVEPGPASFSLVDLQDALESRPRPEFLVVIKREVDNAVYESAERAAVPVSGLAELKAALHLDWDVREHLDKEESYLRSRLRRVSSVEGVRRRGYRAYTVDRVDRPPVTFVGVSEYEFTADEVHNILDRYQDVQLDALVSTNPNCRGFSRASREACREARIPLFTLNDFLQELESAWT